LMVSMISLGGSRRSKVDGTGRFTPAARLIARSYRSVHTGRSRLLDLSATWRQV